MRTMIWRGLLGFAAPVLCALAAIAQPQVYPSRSITVVVPFPAGGPSDVVARIVTDEMAKILGQSMVIENVGGAGGTIGSARVATAQLMATRCSRAAWDRTSPPVCIENLIRFDCVVESHNVSANGRADILLAEHGCLALQVEEPA
jgi:putative tricarboxylic transport membrane protein